MDSDYNPIQKNDSPRIYVIHLGQANVDLNDFKDLLGHKYVLPAQIYA